jgi:hypothetical protein
MFGEFFNNNKTKKGKIKMNVEDFDTKELRDDLLFLENAKSGKFGAMTIDQIQKELSLLVCKRAMEYFINENKGN